VQATQQEEHTRMPPALVYTLVSLEPDFWRAVQEASLTPLVIVQADGLPDGWNPPPDILITGPDDGPTGGNERPKAGCFDRVVLGGQGPADAICLPADVTPRELGVALSLMARAVDLRRQQRAESDSRRRLERMALRDPLTGLPNRRAWNQQLRSPHRRRRTDRWCIALLDLDGFKQINTLHGHVTGDRVLRAVGKALARHLRESDFAARLGGDEFGLLLADLSADDAPEVLERLRSEIRTALYGRGLPELTGSIGWTMLERSQSCYARRTLKEISERLRQAKRSQRGRVVGAIAVA
jgi:diguanylate cyclase (GGDEF)-like protein